MTKTQFVYVVFSQRKTFNVSLEHPIELFAICSHQINQLDLCRSPQETQDPLKIVISLRVNQVTLTIITHIIQIDLLLHPCLLTPIITPRASNPLTKEVLEVKTLSIIA